MAEELLNEKSVKEEESEKAKDIIPFHKFVEIPLFFLQSIGVIIAPNVHFGYTLKLRGLFYFSAILTLLCITFIWILFFKSFADGTAHFTQSTQCILHNSFNSLAVVKVTVLVKNAKRICDLIGRLHQLFPTTSIESQRDFKIKENCDSTRRIILICLGEMFFLVTIFVTFGAMRAGSVDKNGSHFPFNYIYPMWYPFDPYHHGLFESIYMSHSWINYSNTVAILAVDSFLLSFVQQICMHFDQLTKTLQETKAIKDNSTTEKQTIRQCMEKHIAIFK